MMTLKEAGWVGGSWREEEEGPWGIWMESYAEDSGWLKDGNLIIFNTIYWPVAKAQLEICEIYGVPECTYEIRKIQ